MLSIVLFGAPELFLGRQPLTLLRRKSRALLYYLAAHGEPLRRERLLSLLWPDHDRPAAQHSLRTMLHSLRQTIGPALIVIDETLALESGTEVDVRRFATELLRPPSEPPRLQATLDLYRGDFLADFTLPDSPAFDDWVVTEREQYRQLAVRGLTILAQQQAARRAWPAALAAITRAIDLDPLREDVQSIAMQLQYLSGDRTGAIRRYEQLCKLLDDELGLPPMAETRAVYDAIITERLRPEAVPPAAVEPDRSLPSSLSGLAATSVVPAQPEPPSHVAPILATKLYLPRPRAALVPRPRLLARLTAGLSGPLTLIAAPAGFGKTTLLADWLSHTDHQREHVAWLGLDVDDSDPIQFLRYVIAALQTIEPSIGTSILPMLQGTQTPLLETLMPLLAQDLLGVSPESILVLDDYHAVDAPAVHQALAFLLDHLPPQLHLVIATRSDPPLPLPRLRARGQLTELRAAELRFTQDEAAAFLQEVMHLPLTAADVAVLESRTEGWIAGLQLAALSLRDRSGEQQARFIEAFAGSHRFVMDYLVDEVLAHQPGRIQAFLLHTSILKRLSGALCDAVFYGDDGEWGATEQPPWTARASQSILEDLDRSNLFVVPLDDARRWYRYHHLFAQVLRERLAESVRADVIAGLHRRASAWHEQHGLVVEAIQHALTAHDWERAAALMEQHGPTIAFTGGLSTALAWLNELPEEVMHRHPILILYQAATLVSTSQIEAGERRLQDVERSVQVEMVPGMARTILGQVASLRADARRFVGDRERSVELAFQALELLPGIEESLLDAHTVARLNAVQAFLVTGTVADDVEAQVGPVVERTHVSHNRFLRVNGLITLARLYTLQGRLHQAADTYRRVEHQEPQPAVLQVLLNSAYYYVGLADILIEWNDLDSAERLLQPGMDVVRGKVTMDADAIALGYMTLARLQHARGQYTDAVRTLETGEDIMRQRRFAAPLIACVAATKAQIALAHGELAAALQWSSASGLHIQDDLSYPREREYLAFARVSIARGRSHPSSASLPDALHLLRRLLDHAEAGGRNDSVIEILILQGLALHAQGEHGRALAALHRALTLAAPEGYIRVFVDEGAPMTALLAQAISTGSGVSSSGTSAPSSDVQQYAALLLDVFQAEGTIPETHLGDPSGISHPPIPALLTERELDVLRLLAAGHSNRAIAEALVVAVGTAKRHVSNIMDKLQAESRLEAVARARDLDLI